MHGKTKNSIYYRPTLFHEFSVYKEGALPYDTALCLTGQMLGGGCRLLLADCDGSAQLFIAAAPGQQVQSAMVRRDPLRAERHTQYTNRSQNNIIKWSE